MKNLILLSCLLVIVSCTDDNGPIYAVDPELTEYVDSFFQEAIDRGKSIARTNLTVSLRDIEDTTELGVDYSNNGQRYIYFSRKVFNNLNSAGDKISIEYELYKRLSVNYLDKSIYQVVTDMNVEYSSDTREAVLNELFK